MCYLKKVCFFWTAPDLQGPGPQELQRILTNAVTSAGIDGSVIDLVGTDDEKLASPPRKVARGCDFDNPEGDLFEEDEEDEE